MTTEEKIEQINSCGIDVRRDFKGPNEHVMINEDSGEVIDILHPEWDEAVDIVFKEFFPYG